LQNATRQTPSTLTLRIRLAALTLLVLGLPASADSVKPDDWRARGARLEEKSAWAEACRCYEDILRKERGNPIAREGYRRSLRRLHLSTRHADASYRRSIERLAPSQSLEIYEQVLSILRRAYPDRARTNPQQLFQNGLDEMRLALDEPLFQRHQMSGVKPAAIEAFQKRLATWSARITTLGEARDEVLLVICSAPKEGIALRPALVSALTLEFAAGACNTLDEFSSFLTPGSMASVQAALKGKLLGVGIELGVVAERLTVTRVYAKSPAALAGFVKGDHVVKIAGINVENLPPDVAAERLRGAKGTSVEVEIARSKKAIRLSRRSFPVSSVEYQALPLAYGLQYGYLRIHHFQDSTLQEVKDALAAMSKPGDPLRGLVLDLRGNPGGVFKSAVAVAELFLGEGIIVVGQSPIEDFNRAYKADNPAASQIPAVVLIDGDTASAAEVLAAALKESRPAHSPTLLLGQTTFGKGSIQYIIPLEKSPLEKLAGIRLTVARFLSPSSSPVTGRGIAPTVSSDLEGAALLNKAREQLLDLINAAMMPRTVMAGGAS
jgi:carboxyl-terminal processing protease